MTPPSAFPLETLDALWQERANYAGLGVEGLEQRELLADPDASVDAYEWHWRVARWRHFAAMCAIEGNDKANALRLYELAAGHAGEAAKLRATRVEGRFWRGVCVLEASRLKGSIAALRTLSEANGHLEAAVKMDESYHFAGPLRVLGRVTHLKPLILGGVLDNAMAFYTRALQLFPHNTTTLLYLAQAQFADHRPAEGKATLRTLLNAPDDPAWEWEGARDKKEAAKLLAEASNS